MVEVRKEWLERRDRPPSSEMLSASQDKPSKFQGHFSCPLVLYPLSSSRRQQSGCASDRDLGQEHPCPSPAPVEMAASWDEGWGQQLPEAAGMGRRPRKGTGHSSRQLLWQAGSALVAAGARGAVTRRERGGHCSLRLTHHTIQNSEGRSGLGKFVLTSPGPCFERWENAHGTTREGWSELAPQLHPAARLDAG